MEKNYEVVDHTLVQLAQGLRKAHCSKGNDKDHACKGTCTITPTGVKLECPDCGSDTVSYVDSLTADRVHFILKACGIKFNLLSLETQIDACKAYTQTTAIAFYPPSRHL